MPGQVNPQELIQLVYVIVDPSDVGTHYVQSVMRSSSDGTILGTVNLTVDPSNSRRFTGSIQAPAYNGATALYIDIVTTVYTSSAYNTKDTNYYEQVDKFIVAVRWSMAFGGSGGGDAGAFDWERLHRILNDKHKGLLEDVAAMIPDAPPAIDVEALKAQILAGASEGITKIYKDREAVRKSIDRKKAKERRQHNKMMRIAKAVAELPPPEEEKEPLEPAEDKGTLPLEQADAERDLGTAFTAPTVNGPRRPSPGVVPFLLKERNLQKFQKKRKKQ